MKVQWTLHDCWTFTGHCAHFEFIKCNKWQNACEHCPQKKEYPASIWKDNSKNNYRLELSANDGVINNNIYTAPDIPVETSIIAECFLFGGNVATFHVEKKVSVIRPVIICDIKDDNGEEHADKSTI